MRPGAPAPAARRAALAAAARALRALLLQPQDPGALPCAWSVPCGEVLPEDLWQCSDLQPRARLCAPRTGRHTVALGALRAAAGPADQGLHSFMAAARALCDAMQAPVFFAARFAPQARAHGHDDTWDNVGAGLAFVPRLLLTRDERGSTLCVYVDSARAAGDDVRSAEPVAADFRAADFRAALEALDALIRQVESAEQAGLVGSAGDAAPDRGGSQVASADDGPPHGSFDQEGERERFTRGVARALEEVRQGEAGTSAAGGLQKVVLARRARLRAGVARLEEALRHLEAREDNACSYAFAWSPVDAYLGLTPELLYRREGHALHSEAVAGTRARGRNPSEDEALAEELVASAKEQLEHALVRAHIEEALATLGARLPETGSTAVRRLSRVMHLVTELRARLPEGDADHADPALIDALHPTPALAGTPRRAALAFLDAHEGFDRGLYAGPFGVFEPGRAEVWIGLRGARARGDALTLYAGAGVVAASEPAAEWLETEAKLCALREALEALDG